jgi:flagellar protein FlaG
MYVFPGKEAAMEFKTGEIQPVSQEAWMIPESVKKESRAVPPVIKVEGGVSGKIDAKRDGTGQQAAQADPEYLSKVVEKLQNFFQDVFNVDLDFRLDDKTDQMVVRVMNRETGQVIRQIPSEEVVKLREKLEELRGALFNGKA